MSNSEDKLRILMIGESNIWAPRFFEELQMELRGCSCLLVSNAEDGIVAFKQAKSESKPFDAVITGSIAAGERIGNWKNGNGSKSTPLFLTYSTASSPPETRNNLFTGKFAQSIPRFVADDILSAIKDTKAIALEGKRLASPTDKLTTIDAKRWPKGQPMRT